MKRIKLRRSMIQNEILVCPYCMDEKSQDDTGCCHETSAHFDTAYVTRNGTFLQSQVEIIEPIKTRQIFVVLQIETDDGLARVVNAFESQNEAESLYADDSQYEIQAINLNLRQA